MRNDTCNEKEMSDERIDPGNEKETSSSVNDGGVLFKYMQHSLIPSVREALLADGYCVLPSVLSTKECDSAIGLLWTFVEDTSGGLVDRDDSESWYPASANESSDDSIDNDPWPHSGDPSSPETFQSLGAGFVLGPVREILANTVFEPLFGTSELHTSKEGFTFHRPSSDVDVMRNESNVYYKMQPTLGGIDAVRCAVSLTSQEEVTDDDGTNSHFVFYPGSHKREIIDAIIRGCTTRNENAYMSLPEYDMERLKTEFGLQAKHIFTRKGDAVLWRSDLLHAFVPALRSTELSAFGYCSMSPAALTPNYPNVWSQKINAYKWTRSGDHRTNTESFYEHKRWLVKPAANEITSNVLKLQRPHYRLAPPLVTVRLAELYGLIPYDKKTRDKDIERAVIRGVRFVPPESTQLVDLSSRGKGKVCTAWTQELRLSDGTELRGQEKYLGGMSSPDGKYIYGCPGNAARVLRVDTDTNEMDYIGPEYSGHFKWLRGLEIPPKIIGDKYPDGCCLALPSNARSILIINPSTNHVHTFGNLTTLDGAWEGGWSYHGGNLACDGFVYAIPANSTRVLKIDPRNETIECIGPHFSKMKQKWFGGIVGCDGCIYGVPHNATGVLKINPKTQEVSVIGEGTLPEGQWKWHGGLATADGTKIIGFPNNADSVLILDVPSQRVYTVSDTSVLQAGRHRVPQDGRYKYLGGALTSDGRFAYLFPCDAERVLRIDTVTDEVKVVGPLLLEGENKYQNGFVARDGCLYGIPQRASGVLRIVPPGIDGMEGEEEHVDVLYCGEDMVSVKDKFEGGVYGPKDHCIYCIPLRAKALLKVIPGPAMTSPC